MLFNALCRIPGLSAAKDVAIDRLTTFGIGGPAKIFLEPVDEKALRQAMTLLREHGTSYRILGSGSNILVDDDGIPCVISLSALNRMSISDSGKVIRVQAGYSLGRLIARCLGSGLTGLENLFGIPGSVGGAVAMNAGANGDTISNHLTRVRLTGPDGCRWADRHELEWGYRSCRLPGESVVTGAEFRLSPGDAARARAKLVRVISERRMRQPLHRKSAGCVFKNPAGRQAGRLIDSCGLKGSRVGDAEVSMRHANFIVNRGRARAAHVLELMGIIREKVMEREGIDLEPEICLWCCDTAMPLSRLKQ